MNSTLYAILRLYDYLLFVENLFSVRHCEVFLLSQLAPLSKLVVWERDYSPIDKDMYIYLFFERNHGSDAHRQTLDRLKKLDLEMVTNEK